MAKNLNLSVLFDYGKYSHKQRLNRIKQDSVVYSGTINDAIMNSIIGVLIQKNYNIEYRTEDLSKYLKDGYKYIIIYKSLQ